MDQPKLGLVKEADPPDKSGTNSNNHVGPDGAWFVDPKDLEGVDVEEVEEEEEQQEEDEDNDNVKREGEAVGRGQESCDDDEDGYEEEDEVEEGEMKAFGKIKH